MRNRSRLTVLILLAVGLIFSLLVARQLILSRSIPRQAFDKPKLRVLTYSTFVSANGPGADLFKRFEAESGCAVEVVTTPDAGLLLERMKLAKPGAPFDAVIGLDQITATAAKESAKWLEWESPKTDFALPPFVAFDWSPMTFVYREGEEPPHSFKEMLDPKYRGLFALEDPRSSTPGLQFFSWVKDVEGERSLDYLKRFKPNVHSVSPSWSFAYGVFKKKQARYVFSYLTSLAFHWGTENDRSYRAVSLEEGHPVQVEYAGVPANCGECDLAKRFVDFLLEPESQRAIMTKNYMLPVMKGVAKGTVFSELPELKLRAFKPLQKDLNDWDQVFKN